MTALIIDAGALYEQADADEPEHKIRLIRSAG
jgi:hypothetical protein